MEAETCSLSLPIRWVFSILREYSIENIMFPSGYKGADYALDSSGCESKTSFSDFILTGLKGHWWASLLGACREMLLNNTRLLFIVMSYFKTY